MESYKRDKIKHIAALVGWIAIMASYLVQYFHVYRLYILVTASIYLLYVEIIKGFKINSNNAEKGISQSYSNVAREPKSDSKNTENRLVSLTDSADRWLGVTCLTFLGYYVVSLWPFTLLSWKNYFYLDGWELVKFIFDIMIRRLREGDLLMIIFSIVAFGIGFINKNSKKYKVLDILYQYMKYTAVFFLVFYVLSGKIEIGLLFIAIALTYLLVDIIQWKKCGIDKKEASSWFLWFGGIFGAMFILDPLMFLNGLGAEGYFGYFLFVKGLGLKNIIVLSVVLIGLAIICGMLEKKEEQVLSDAFIIMTIESALLVIYSLYRWYVGYWWLILAIYIILSISYILQMKKENAKRQYKVFALLLVATIAFTIGANHGKMLSISLLYVSLYMICYVIRMWENKECDENVIMFAVLGGIALSTFGRIFEVKSLASNYIVLITAVIIFGGILFVMSYDPGMFASRPEDTITKCAIILVLFSVLCTGISFKSGSAIKFEQDKYQVSVSIDAKGKKNTIKEAEAYWMDDYTESIVINGEKKLPESKSVEIISDSTLVSFSNSGRLKVVVTDKYGMKTTAMRWYHVCKYDETSNK